MVISSCHLKTTNGLKNAPETISEGLKVETKIYWGGMPQTWPPKERAAAHNPPPPNFSLSIILPPLSIFVK